jgi:F420-dependent oxidoreductase-like protein
MRPRGVTRIEFNLMIEGQEGLTWDRWRRLAALAEEEGYDGLFRSDHLTGLFGDPRRPALDTWTSLAWLATGTSRVRFGPMVCPLTFYHPGLLAKQAAAVDQLSGGRLDLGLGAGWNEHEHRMFGIPFPPLRERMDRLECGVRAIRALWRGEPVTLDQPFAPLVEAQSYPRPVRGAVPVIIGGRGERRTLRIVAAHADEWNVTRVTFDELAHKAAVLAEHCRAVGRDPAAIRRSLMVPLVIGESAADVDARRRRARAEFPRLPGEAAEWRAAAFLHGGPDELVADLRRWAALGISRVMLQLADTEDAEALRLFARTVAPAFR